MSSLQYSVYNSNSNYFFKKSRWFLIRDIILYCFIIKNIIGFIACQVHLISSLKFAKHICQNMGGGISSPHATDRPDPILIIYSLNCKGYIISIMSMKNTHISRINNSVAHLWSYTNSAIAGNSVLAAERQYRRTVRQYCHIKCRYECFTMFNAI